MSKKRDTWMPLYIGDYLADTGRLTTEAHGAYLLLIMDYWRNGAPADDDEMLAAITKLPPQRWKKVRQMLEPLFQIEDGIWRQKRVEEELTRACSVVANRKAAGKAGAEARWGAGGGKRDGKKDAIAIGKPIADAMANASQTVWQNDAPSPSPSQLHESITTTEENPARKVVDRFLALRSELWPNESGFPSHPATLLTIAREWLDGGGSASLICETIERGMRNMAKSDPNAPTSLNAFRKSVTSAIARANQRAREQGEYVPAEKPNPELMQKSRDRMVGLFKTGTPWHPDLGPEPGKPGCLASPEVLRAHGYEVRG